MGNKNQGQNNRKKNKNLYYAVIALFLILSGVLGSNQQDENTDNNVAIESQVDNEVSDSQNETDIAESNNDEAVADENNGSEDNQQDEVGETVEITYTFRNEGTLESHYEKHGIEMGFENPEEYLAAANKVVANPDALHKLEKEDGDDVYYLEATNEFVVVSTDGYIRTYFLPDDGIDYYNRQ